MHKKAGTLSIVCLVVIGMAVASMPLFAQRASAQAVTWARTYGGAGEDRAYSIWQTTDGGYVVAGRTNSFGAGTEDAWVLRLDPYGAIQWQKTYGHPGGDFPRMIRQTPDGGYLMAGYTYAVVGLADAWILKLDAGGSVQWQKTYGSSTRSENLRAIELTSDGGYIFVGSTFPKSTSSDLMVVKIDSSGNMAWQKTYTSDNEWGVSIKQTPDGGYIVAGGISYTVGSGKNQVTYSNVVFLMKLDSSGAVTWQKQYSGFVEPCFAHDFYGPAVQLSPDGLGYVVTGATARFNNLYVFKVDLAGNMVWQEKIDSGNSYDPVYALSAASDGGYILVGQVGYTDPPTQSKVWAVKLDGGGAIQWQKLYDGAGYDAVYGLSAVQQTSDGGYVIAGLTSSWGSTPPDIWILKVDATGNIGGCGPDCVVSDGSGTLTPTTNSPVVTPMIAKVSAFIVANTAVVPADTAAIVNTQCAG